MEEKGFGKDIVIIIVFFVVLTGIIGIYFLAGSQAIIKVQRLSPSREKIGKGDSVPVKVKVTNIGGSEGSTTFILNPFVQWISSIKFYRS